MWKCKVCKADQNPEDENYCLQCGSPRYPHDFSTRALEEGVLLSRGVLAVPAISVLARVSCDPSLAEILAFSE